MYWFVSQLLRPYTLLVLLLLVAALVQWRRPAATRWWRLLVTIAAVLLYLISCPLFGWCALYSLERLSPPLAARPTASDTIVVLSGGLVSDPVKGSRPGTDTAQRCLAGLSLYRQAGGGRLLLSGGRPTSDPNSPTLAAVMRDFLLELGVPASDLMLEERSTTTHGNAAESARILNAAPAGRVFLVTDATHMLRARRCFAAQGVEVVPAPCNFRAWRLEFNVGTLLPSDKGVQATETAFHEWLGLAWYWLKGRI